MGARPPQTALDWLQERWTLDEARGKTGAIHMLADEEGSSKPPTRFAAVRKQDALERSWEKMIGETSAPVGTPLARESILRPIGRGPSGCRVTSALPFKKGAPLLALVACMATAPSCDRSAGSGADRIAFEACRPEGIQEEVRCGSLSRPESPEDPKGRQVRLSVVVLPARNAHPRPDPLYVVAGGPGQSALGTAPLLKGLFDAVRKERDVVLVDQRGTGKSGALECALEQAPGKASAEGTEKGSGTKPSKEAPPPLAQRLKKEDSKDETELKKCLEKVAAQADPRFYGTRLAVEDLDAVRRSSGHDRINLWGISYGTRVVADYVRRHGDRVRAAVVDAVVPPGADLVDSMGTLAASALRKTFSDCEADEGCAKAFPRLEERFMALLEKAESAPMKLEGPDPLTGEPIAVEVDGKTLAALVRNFLYDPDLSSLLPLTIDALDKGDARTFLAQADAATRSTEGISQGMHLSVFCGEDFDRHVRRTGGKGVPDAVAAGTQAPGGGGADRLAALFAGETAGDYEESCALWPHGQPPEDLFQPLASDVPFLVLSGALDPVTPPPFGQSLADGLANARHVVSPGASHGVTPRGCGPAVVARFLKRPEPAALDAACLEGMARPPFFVSFAGPKP